MHLVTTSLSVLRQRATIAPFFSKKWSLPLRQPIRGSSLLRTDYSNGNSELSLARYPNGRRFSPGCLSGARSFSKGYISSSEDNRDPFLRYTLPANVVVPKVWPHVPVIAIDGIVIFPPFKGFIDFYNPDKLLIDLIHRKIKLNQPYIGMFVKKAYNLFQNYEGEVVENLDDIYSIGTFAQILSVKHLNDLLTLSIRVHRRIKIINQLVEYHHPEHDRNEIVEKTYKKANSTEVNLLSKIFEQSCKSDVSSPQRSRQPVLLVEVVNVMHNNYKQTEKIKALIQEINKTIHDISRVDTSFIMKRKMYQPSLRDIKNPVYLCDLATTLTIAHAQKSQKVLEEMDILKRLKLTLALLKNKLSMGIRENELKRQLRNCIFHERNTLRDLKKPQSVDF